MNRLNYSELKTRNDFEYFFRFKKFNNNFEVLWRMKSSARESLREWLTAIDASPKNSEVISNAASELIENCIKYSKVESYSFVYIRVDGNKIGIETMNKATPDQKRELDYFMKSIKESDLSVTEIYIKKMIESINNKKSQLGILRIMMETEGTVDVVEDNDKDVVHFSVLMEVD